jgi:hypothetical protein
MMKKACFLIFIFSLLFPAIAFAEDVGLVVALKGNTLILRDNKTLNAVLKDRIFFRDTLETKEASRAKMLFRDDSLLTLAEKTRLNIREYLTAEGRRKGRSVFDLVDGKVRSLVGANEFEIRTPTVVVAARGTYFITWTGIEDGVPVSGITVLEGIVEVRNINPAIVGVVKLERGTMSKVFENKPPAPPMPVPQTLMNELLDATKLQSIPEADKEPVLEEKMPTGVQPVKPPLPVEEEILSVIGETIPSMPRIENQPPPKLQDMPDTPVRIHIPMPPAETPVDIKIPIPEGL